MDKKQPDRSPQNASAAASHPHHKRDTSKPGSWKFTYWLLGIGSMIWLLLRSGTKTRRLAYPCQRIAAANSIGFLAYLASLLGSAALLRRLKVAFTPTRLTLLVVGLLLTVSLQTSVTTPVEPILAESSDLPGWTSDTAVSAVSVITNIPEPQYSLDGGDIPGGVDADEALHDDGVDALVDLMGANGDYFYQITAHPDGLFASDDVIVIKVNNQWGDRNGTNSDVVKGVIYRLVQHPDGFTGAVIIAENSQGTNEDWYDDPSENNSQFQDQSYLEVTQAFAGEGYHVCIADWRAFRSNFVDDYDTGNNSDGYVLDSEDVKLSYPKFQVDCNGLSSRVSMRKGLWNGSNFDNTRLKMINLPVLKRHNCAWATIAVKNYLGFITTYDDMGRWSDVSEMHCWLLGPSDNGYSCTPESTAYGLLGRQMARIRRADLNIVDAIWVNPSNNLGGGSRRQDVLLASRDPFAVDYYASDYVLYPLVDQFSSTPEPEQAKASTRGGWFRNIQMRNVARLRAEGITDTINMDDSMTVQQELNQFNVYVADATVPTAPTLTLQEPNGGEVWYIGTQQQIEWASTNLDGDVRLDYSTDGFVSSTLIDASTANDGAYTWTVPNDPSDTVLVRVSSTLTATISDTSNAVFTITPMPTLTLQAPNGGETWTVGDQQQITWASSGDVGDVTLEYSTNEFVSATVIVASTADDGSYTWTIPDDPSANVLVRVSSTLHDIISDTSDAVFTIASVPLTPTLTLQSPNGGEVWTIGTQQQIKWSSTNLEGKVQLEYSTNGFASATVITSSTANDGVYGWNIPVDLSTNVLVRVSSVLSSTISDTSDAAFTIAGPYTFDDSYKAVSHHNLEGGERMTYTIVLYEAISATLTLTDVIPAPLTYVPGSAIIEPPGSGSLELPGTSVRWSGIVTGTAPVTITFQVDVPDVGTLVVPITNRALVSRNGASPEELTARSIINGLYVYLPVVLKSY